MGKSADICMLELWAALLALRMVNRAPAALLQPVDSIYLIIDNKPVVEWIGGDWTIRNPYARSTLRDIYTVMGELHNKHGVEV